METGIGDVRGWAFEPAHVLPRTDTGTKAAIWADADPVERFADPPANQDALLIAVALSSHWAQVRIDGGLAFERKMMPGVLHLVRPGEAVQAVKQGEMTCLHIEVPSRSLASFADEHALTSRHIDLRDPACGEYDGVIQHLGLAVVEAQKAGPVDQLLSDSLTQSILSRVVGRYGNTRPGAIPEVRGGLSKWQLQRVCRRMTEDFASSVSLQELSALAGLSQSHFSRAFKVSLDMSPFQWRQVQRIDYAMQLLKTGRFVLAQVAGACGFSDQSSFTENFTRLVGTSPARWQRENSTRVR